MFTSMMKKTLTSSAILALMGTFMFGRDAISYLRTGCNNVRNVVKSEVPLEFEIERARLMVDQLVPDMRQCVQAIAEQEIDVEYRQATLAREESALSNQKETILDMRANLTSGKDSFVYAGRVYSASDVKHDLAHRFERFKVAEEVLAADRKILQAREQTLVANRSKLDGMQRAKKELEVNLEQLQARVQTVRNAETVSHLTVDDSNLSHARRLISDLNKQLDVKQRTIDNEAKFADLIPIESNKPEIAADLEHQIDHYFGHSADPVTIANNE